MMMRILKGIKDSAVKACTQTIHQMKALALTAPSETYSRLPRSGISPFAGCPRQALQVELPIPDGVNIHSFGCRGQVHAKLRMPAAKDSSAWTASRKAERGVEGAHPDGREIALVSIHLG